jgi:hypothetical protein
MRIVAAITAIALAAGCSSRPSPTAPTAPTAQAPSVSPAPQPAAQPAAELEIITFEMKYLRFELGYYVYVPEIVLTEKSGQSSARLNEVALRMPNGNTNFLGCSAELRVPAAGTWKLTDLVFWCRDVDSADDISGSPVTVSVKFTDEYGVTGHVTSTAIAEAVR